LPVNILGVADVPHYDPNASGSERTWLHAGIFQGLLRGVRRELRAPPHLAQIPLWDIKSGKILDPAAEGTSEA
jgi:hypothetical protein